MFSTASDETMHMYMYVSESFQYKEKFHSLPKSLPCLIDITMLSPIWQGVLQRYYRNYAIHLQYPLLGDKF